LDISKAKNKLGWEPRLTLEETVKLTVDWYKRYKSMSALDLCLEQIRYYMKKEQEVRGKE